MSSLAFEIKPQTKCSRVRLEVHSFLESSHTNECNSCVRIPQTNHSFKKAKIPLVKKQLLYKRRILNVVPEQRSRACRVSLLSPAAHVCRYTASCLWHDLSRSSEPIHMHLRITHTHKIQHYLKKQSSTHTKKLQELNLSKYTGQHAGLN